MWNDFIASWPLFHHSYLAGLAMAMALGLTGVMVVARNQIFLGAAVAQASTFGIALLLCAAGASATMREHVEHTHGLLHGIGILFSVGAALAASRSTSPGRESREGLTGWIFLGGASCSVLLVASSPHGLEEIQRLQMSSLIGATRGDVIGFALLAAAGLLVALRWRRRLILLAVDPVMASAVGLRVGAWSTGLAVWIGVVIGASIYSAGALFTFGCLILPAMLARSMCREIAPMFWLAPLLSGLAAAMAFVLANHFDFPPGQMVVALLAAALPPAWLSHRCSGGSAPLP